MMSKLRKLFLLTGEYDIFIRTRYISSNAKVWAYCLSRETDNSDFRYHDKRWGPHSIDRFASFESKQLQRYNAN